MKPTEILTAIVAVYAAILSTINLVVAIRAKRWHVVVTYSIGVQGGKRLIIYRAINLGERDVALKSFSVESLPEKKGFLRRIVHALNFVATLGGIRIKEESMFTEAFVVKCEPPLPLDLNAGRACEMTVDQGRLLDSLFSQGCSPSWSFRRRNGRYLQEPHC